MDQTLITAEEITNHRPELIKQENSFVLPEWQLFVLGVATGGLYFFYWFFSNWKHFKIHKDLDISPGWRTVGLFIPIYGLMLVYRQLQAIRKYAAEAGIEPTFYSGAVLMVYIVICGLGRLPDPYWLISTLFFVPFHPVQRTLNAYWRQQQPGLAVRNGLSIYQVIVILLGCIGWGFILLGMNYGLKVRS